MVAERERGKKEYEITRPEFITSPVTKFQLDPKGVGHGTQMHSLLLEKLWEGGMQIYQRKMTPISVPQFRNLPLLLAFYLISLTNSDFKNYGYPVESSKSHPCLTAHLREPGSPDCLDTTEFNTHLHPCSSFSLIKSQLLDSIGYLVH